MTSEAKPAAAAGTWKLGDMVVSRLDLGAMRLTGSATRDEIITLLEKLSAERGLTIVLVTHDSAIARPPMVTVMSQGRLALA